MRAVAADRNFPGLNSVTNGTQGARNAPLRVITYLEQITQPFSQNPYGVAAPIDVMRNYVGQLPCADCVLYADTDGDGFTDDIGRFPQDPDEWSDQDNDGVGDNSDAFLIGGRWIQIAMEWR